MRMLQRCWPAAWLSLAACSSWSAPPVVPILGPLPRQILIMPVASQFADAMFAAELNEAIGAHVEARGYQSIWPAVTRNLLGSYGWMPDDPDRRDLPLAALRSDHQIDAVLVTEILDWQSDREAGRYRYRLSWKLIQCESGAEIWRFDDGGQVSPALRRGVMRVIYPEDVALGPGPTTEVYRAKPISSQELASKLQRNMALRLPLAAAEDGKAWRERK